MAIALIFPDIINGAQTTSRWLEADPHPSAPPSRVMDRINRLQRRWTMAFSHVPPEQLARYLLVGAWNTFFGYLSFAVLAAVFDPLLSHGYIVALLVSSLLNITVSFLGYKWFVFRTKGRYLREWMRCITVYSSGIFFGAIILPIVVESLRYGARLGRYAPYVGGALLTVFGIIYNFFGHKKFSFQSSVTSADKKSTRSVSA